MRLAVLGAGAVGSAVADLAAEYGQTVTALADSTGAAVDPDGVDIAAALDAKREEGRPGPDNPDAALDGEYDDDVVTELEPLETFYEAQEYHQDYFEKNPNDAYCRMHARPKVKKVREKFRNKLKN